MFREDQIGREHVTDRFTPTDRGCLRLAADLGELEEAERGGRAALADLMDAARALTEFTNAETRRLGVRR